MKAWRFHALGDWRLDDVPEPQPGQGEILVKIRAVQPSVSEVAIAEGGPTINADRFVRLVKDKAPIQALGHEFAGEVVAAGHHARRYRVGDRVACFSPVVPCGHCLFCQDGRPYACADGPILGYELPGCFAEYAAMPEACVVPISDGMSFRAGACVQSLESSMACAMMARDRMRGGTVVVLGQGVLGLALTQMARHLGARQLITVARRPESLRLSREFGADTAINADQQDVVKAILDQTNGRGANVVFECAGGPEGFGLAGQKTLLQALAIAAKEGLVVQPATVVGNMTVDAGYLRNNRLNLSWPRALAPDEAHLLVEWMAAGIVRVEPTITHTVHGIASANRAFQITRDRRRLGGINPCQVVM